jgi:hypothetical protein
MSPLLPTGRRRLPAPETIPEHPYRDTAILHVALGVVICVFAIVTGGDLSTAALVAAGYVVIAVAWSWWRFSQRIRAARVAAETGTHRDGAA